MYIISQYNKSGFLVNIIHYLSYAALKLEDFFCHRRRLVASSKQFANGSEVLDKEWAGTRLFV